ncbi:dTDP-4-dehydrorhamnose reductase [uncultured Adlercreutzia sp.]|uniref:dTDP-4-dehydrorhamnose reductase n=1 Tax=uncultured Adlercreutzia sp. TaxID=875803 RepID=UPI0025CEEF5D|nr:dTDP-4-dehydrorhamnose reductase [uncultured Adlercreutzia sp.]
MRILVVGSNGQLGTELRRCLEAGCSEIGAIPPCYFGAEADYVDGDAVDISDQSSVDAWFSDHEPYDLIINCAAMTNVDGCEADEAGALRVNALGAMHLAQKAQESGAKFVQVSTDYVFSGELRDRPLTEEDAVCPISSYGRSKLAGEILAADACDGTFVVRTAWLYGRRGRNFVKTMARLARENGKISVVSDQVGCPTSANDLAHEILRLAATDGYGVYHCVNRGSCSWFDFASRAVDALGIPCKKEPISTEEYKRRFPASAPRPQYSVLENARFDRTIGSEMREWQDALDSYLSAMSQEEGLTE